jgi:hypothetical protein
MSKRSRRIAKRDEFENTLKEMEKKIRSRSGNKSAAIAPESTGRPEAPDDGSEEVEKHNPEK